jgi:hypothetical protein
VTLEAGLDNAQGVISQLGQIDGVRTRVDGQKVIITSEVNGTEEGAARLEFLSSVANGLDGDAINMAVNLSGVPEAMAELATWQAANATADGDDIHQNVDLDTGAAMTGLAAWTSAVAGSSVVTSVLTRMAAMASIQFVAIGAAAVAAAAALVPVLGGLAAIGGMGAAAAAGLGLVGGAIYVMVKGLYDGGVAFASLSAAASALGGQMVQVLGPASLMVANVGLTAIDVASNYIPILAMVSSRTAAGMQTAFGSFLSWISTTGAGFPFLVAIMNEVSQTTTALTEGFLAFGQGVIAILGAAAPYASQLAEFIRDIAFAFSEWAQSAQGQAQITAAIETAIPIFKALWDMVVQVGGALLEFSVAAGPGLADAISATATVLTALIRALTWVSQNVGLADAAIAVLAVTLAGLAFVASPVLAVIAIIAALAGAAALVIANWGVITEFFRSLWTGVAGAFMSGVTAVTTTVTAWWASLMAIFAAIGTSISIAITGIITAVQTAITTAFTALITFFSTIWATIAPFLALWLANVQAFFTMLLNVFIIATAAILGAVILAFQGIYNGVVAILSALFSWIQAGWAALSAILGPILSALGAAISAAWNGIVAAVSPIIQAWWDAVVAMFDAGSSAVQAVIQAVSDFLIAAWQAISDAVTPIVQALWDFIVSAWQAVSDAVTPIVQALWDFIVAAWQAISDTVTPIVQALWDFIVLAWTTIQEGVTAAVQALWDFIVSAWQAISDAVTPIVQALWDFIVSAWDGISSYTTQTYDQISTYLSDIWNQISTTVTDAAQAVWDAVVAAWDGIVSDTTAFGANFLSAVTDAFWAAVAEGGDAIASLLEGIGQAAIDVGIEAVASAGQALVAAGGQVRSITGAAIGGVMGYRSGGGPGFRQDRVGGRGGMGTRSNQPRVHLWNEQQGPEAYIAKKGPRTRQLNILDTAASWYGMQVVGRGSRNGRPGGREKGRRFASGGLAGFCDGGTCGARCSCDGSIHENFRSGGLVGMPVKAFYCGGQEWDEDVGQIVSQISGALGGASTPNTYAGHPGGQGRSVDWWGPSGCPEWVGGTGDTIEGIVTSKYADQLTYYIWQGVLHGFGGSQDYCAEDPYDCHFDHIHTTFSGASGGGGVDCKALKSVFSAAVSPLVAAAKSAVGVVDFPMLVDMGQGYIDGTVADMIDWFVSNIPGCAGSKGGGGGGGDCASQLQPAIDQLGVSGRGYENTMPGLIQCESGGDSGAINDWDSNAAAGTPSIGCTQMIQPTFDAYAQPNCTDISDPLCNIMASIAYQEARYGGPVPGCPYNAGGLGTAPHIGFMEKGDFVLPLHNGAVMAQARKGIGVEGIGVGLEVVASEVRGVREEVKQTRVTLPSGIGSVVRNGVRENIALAPDYREALGQSAEVAALRMNFSGSGI